MNELKSCPFCGGNARISAKDYLFGGYNGKGESRRMYQLRAICNKCKSRGKPITTDWVKSNYCNRGSYFTSQEDKKAFFEAEQKAIEAWNRRA